MLDLWPTDPREEIIERLVAKRMEADQRWGVLNDMSKREWKQREEQTRRNVTRMVDEVLSVCGRP